MMNTHTPGGSTRRMIVAVTGRKGGVGKTTAAILIASRAVEAGLSVALLDLDPQGSASVTMGVDPDSASVRLLLGRDTDPVTIAGGVRLYSGGRDASTYLPKVSATDARKLLEGLADLVLLDCPPGHTEIDTLAAAVADRVLVCADSSRMGLAAAIRTAKDLGVEDHRLALLVGRHDARRSADAAAPDLLRGVLDVRTRVLTMRQAASVATDISRSVLPRLTPVRTEIDTLYTFAAEDDAR